MPLARLENFLKNLNGNTLYVDPSELDSTDSIENRGNSRLRPFKTIQRALLEAARFSYIAGSNNDLFDNTTILISPGTHYIDNRPGYYVNSSSVLKDINNSTQTISEFNVLSNFDITDSQNELYIYNSVDGGVILPKGTSLVASDLRKTKIRPLFVPDPANSVIDKTAIFRLTGSCYFFGFTLFDGDPLGTVYNTYSTTRVTPSYSHHKLTAFEYADGVNKVTKNGNATGHTDLEMYYYKLALGFGQQSGRSVIDGYNNFQPNIDEYRIVGDLGAGEINITNVKSGDGTTGTNVITVTTNTEHGLSALTPIIISGVGVAEGTPTTTEYNGNFVVAQVLSDTSFTYLLSAVPTGSLQPSTEGASVKVISDTTSSSSPYVFNCSLKSVYGMNGLHADGSKATGFRSMVTAQFTGISLQKDDRAFVKYNNETGSYQDQTSFGIEQFLHQEADSIYQPEWSSTHIKASNDAFIQCVSIFAIGYSNQFVASEGGDQSITNSNSNFGERALFSEGFKKDAFPKDDHGFITHIIPPKDVSLSEQNINTYALESGLPNTTTRVYLKGFRDVLSPPNPKIRKYAIGGRDNDKIHYTYAGSEYYADINPSGKIDVGITSIRSVSDVTTPNNCLVLSSTTGISTGLAVKIIAKDSLLPDGIEHDQTYFAKPLPVAGNLVRIYENLANCNSDTGDTGTTAVQIQNTIGLTSGNLSLVSRVSDLAAGDVGSPIQWDSTVKSWYVGITTNAGSPTFISQISSLGATPTLYLKRVIDTRLKDDKSYRVRYVLPRDAQNAALPTQSFVLQKSATALNGTYTQGTSVQLTSAIGEQLETIRNKNAIIDAYYSSSTATIFTKNPHKLRQGNTINIYNLKSSAEPNPVGLGSGTGFNGTFEVASVIDENTFTYSIGVNPGTITAGVSAVTNWLSLPRNCSQSSNFRVPPYTIYDTDNSGDRANLPYFTCNQVENHYQVSKIRKIQNYVQGSSDGIYYITLDAYKNKPNVSPFNTDDYKFSQGLDNVYPKSNDDNLVVDPDPSTTVAYRKTIGAVRINDPYLSSTKETTVEYLKDFNLGQRITGFVKSGGNVTVTTERNHGIGGVRRVVVDTAGSGYVNGTFYDIPLCGGTGSNATVNVTVVGGTPTTFEIANSGSGYTPGDTLTIKGIPGSTNSTTVTIPAVQGLNFSTTDPDLIQIIGANNSGNNGAFVISSVTANTITFANTAGVTEATTSAVLVSSGPGFSVNSASYTSTVGVTTVTTTSTTPHSLAVGNKLLFDVSNLGICTVTSVINETSFNVSGDASTATRFYPIGLSPTLKDVNSSNENLTTRQFAIYGGLKDRLDQNITTSDTFFSLDNNRGFNKGDFIQIDNEIMLITKKSGINVYVTRALLGTAATSHNQYTPVKTISILPIELRRPSILRASGQTFEYTGFGPGNYSTAMPSNQTKVLNNEEIVISQSLSNRAGFVVYTGMNSNGEFFIGKKKFDASTGDEVIDGGTGAEGGGITDLDSLTVNKLTVNDEIDATTAVTKLKDLKVSGIATFANATDSTSCTTGAVVIEGGVGIGKSVNICGNLTVAGISTFKSNVTVSVGSSFIGQGTIPIGGIIMWSGTVANIPTGWALCNGSNGTPDLRNKFIVGAFSDTTDTTYPNLSPAATGGTADAVVVSHNHTVNSGNSTATFVTSIPGETINVGNGNSGSVTVGDNGSGTQGSVSIDTVGVSGINQNLPPYYALAFIMRTL